MLAQANTLPQAILQLLK
ncbi:hypothetical protein [Paenibacillus sp. FSL R5-0527]